MIFDLDYINYVWYLLTPPDHRQPIDLALGASVMVGKQWKHDTFFQGYMQGAAYLTPPVTPTGNAYNTATIYVTGNRIIYLLQAGGIYYGDNAVYEAISINSDGSNNAGFSNAPPTGNNIVPQTPPASALVSTVAALTWLSNYKWIQVQPNFIGANERASYSCQKLIFEYALNKWFNTTFRNPPSVSDIYIKANTILNNRFYFFPQSVKSFFTTITNFPSSPSPVSDFFFPSSEFSPQNDYTIYIPTAIYNALSITPGLRGGVVRAFADLINPAGAFYNIITY